MLTTVMPQELELTAFNFDSRGLELSSLDQRGDVSPSSFGLCGALLLDGAQALDGEADGSIS
jgi:hypothetical protein